MSDNSEGVDRQPDELNEVRKLTNEFLEKKAAIDNEIETLKQDLKDLVDEYSSKLDMKTLKAAMKVVDIKAKVNHKDTFDNFLEVLEN